MEENGSSGGLAPKNGPGTTKRRATFVKKNSAVKQHILFNNAYHLDLALYAAFLKDWTRSSHFEDLVRKLPKIAKFYHTPAWLGIKL